MPLSSSIWMRSGLKSPPTVLVLPNDGSPPVMPTPPWAVGLLVFSPLAGLSSLSTMVKISPKPLVGLTATGVLTVTSIPSRASKKSMPSLSGSKVVRPSSSRLEVGGFRPALPPICTAEMAGPAPRSVSVGAVSCVIDRLPGAAPLATNSDTVPVTSRRWPLVTAGALPVKTKIASDVAALPSPVASWM